MYTQIKFSIKPSIVSEFKAKCRFANVSMASEISRFMSGQAITKKQDTTTRQHRRKAIKSMVKELEEIMDAEQRYMDNIPENLQSSRTYEAAEQTVQALEEALGILTEAY
jgi:hypothetical protein